MLGATKQSIVDTQDRQVFVYFVRGVRCIHKNPAPAEEWQCLHVKPKGRGVIMAIQSLVTIAAGIFIAFSGYSMFRGMLPLWGFVLGGGTAYMLLSLFAPALVGEMAFQLIAFMVGGIIGAMMSEPLYYVIVFFSGAALGMICGVMVGALVDMGGFHSIEQISGILAMSFPPAPQTVTQLFFMIVIGVVLGTAAIGFQRFMITAASAFIGATLIMTGMQFSVSQMAANAMGRGAIIMVGWLMLGMIAILVQFRTAGDV